MQTTTEHRTIDKRYVSVWVSGSSLISYGPNKKKIQYDSHRRRWMVVAHNFALSFEVVRFFRWFSSILHRGARHMKQFRLCSLRWLLTITLWQYNCTRSLSFLYSRVCVCASDGEKFLHLSRVSKYENFATKCANRDRVFFFLLLCDEKLTHGIYYWMRIINRTKSSTGKKHTKTHTLV